MDNKQNFHSNMVLPPLGGETSLKNEKVGDSSRRLPEVNNNNVVQVEKDQTQAPIDISSINFTTQKVDSTTNTGVDDLTHVDDNDTTNIPKEWIVKAKKIITLTSNDPRAQNIEINKLKAEYMKKRFNIDLKLADE